ncbi:MAG TPA: hypothetical protein VE988_22330 [Gemmataceae bacterium]|nr:hypothetical protein [Gemmataceae bacterium]
MPELTIQQALYLRPSGDHPRVLARSNGFIDVWQGDIEQILLDFGDRPIGIICPAALFAQPLGKDQVVIVQVTDQPATDGPPYLRFHVLVVPLAAYRKFLGDPFAVAERFPPPWQRTGSELPELTMPAEPLPRRTVAEVQKVLKRVKASALREDEDPAAVELTVENAESPALLGGVQILVDGGKLMFVRPAPDPGLIRALWTLLPDTTRSQLWPATFAFSNALGFDAVVVPRPGQEDLTGYTTEQQAADYPAGRYELNLQTAAESGDQAALDGLFGRRSQGDMLRLALLMVVALSISVFLFRFFDLKTPPEQPPPLSPEQRERVAFAAATVANGDPWAAVALHEAARYRRAERVASAAAIVASGDPFAAMVQLRAAQARYVEIWKADK